MAIAFHAHKVRGFRLTPFGIHPAAPMTRYRSLFKDAKPALTPVLGHTQAFFLRIVPDDMDGFAVRKTEAGARSG